MMEKFLMWSMGTIKKALIQAVEHLGGIKARGGF
jgi:hypothetical protein